jgi:hypothetical protein
MDIPYRTGGKWDTSQVLQRSAVKSSSSVTSTASDAQLPVAVLASLQALFRRLPKRLQIAASWAKGYDRVIAVIAIY